MPGTVNFHTRPSTGPPQHHTARDHVMQRLLSLREARHDVADEHGNHVRYDLAEVPPRCARKADALPTHISDDQAQRFSFARATGRHFGKIITNMVPMLINRKSTRLNSSH